MRIGGSDLDMTYLVQPPKRYTFEQPKLKQWVESWCKGKVLNVFAGKVKLDVDEVRVDIDSAMPCDFCMDSFEFVTAWRDNGCDLFDTIILDPPYNVRKSREKYEGRYIGEFTKLKNALSSILSVNGRVITLGYDTVGMSMSRGFRKIAVCVWFAIMGTTTIL